MKKIMFAVFSLFFLFYSGSAQPLTTPKDQFKQQLTAIFQQANLSLQKQNLSTSPIQNHQGPARPPAATSWIQRLEDTVNTSNPLPKREGAPWQMALFLAAADRPIAETLGTIRWSIRHGYIMQAAVLDLSPSQHNRDFQFYFIYADGRKTRTEQIAIPAETDTNILLEQLTEHLQQYNDTLQTGLIIDAHGNPENMYFDRDAKHGDWFTLQQLMSAAEKYNLHIDVLHLISCHVGTISNIQSMLKQVDYTVISSDIAIGDPDQFYFSLIQYACYTARKAARLAGLWVLNHNSPWYSDTAINAMALDLKQLNSLDDWGEAYMDLCGSKGKNIDFPSDDHVISLRRFVSKQIQNVRNDNIQAVCTQNDYVSEEQKEAFIQTGEALLFSLDQTIMTQWCLPPNKARFITQRFTENGCTDGPSLNRESWQTLWNRWEHTKRSIYNIPDF